MYKTKKIKMVVCEINQNENYREKKIIIEHQAYRVQIYPVNFEKYFRSISI